MAITQNTFNGDGSNLGPFSFTFKWLEPTDIKVTVSGVLKTAGTHYNLQSLNYATKSGGQVLFTAGNAPAVGTGNIVIYRQTDDSDLSATFNSGSAIRAQDLNDNFIQGLYVTQESSNNAATAISTAEGAVTTANAATATANSAVSTANSAVSTANAATATANTAASDAAAAVSTANTASTNASAAVATANTASTNASAAVSTANSAAADVATAISTANGAVSTANSAAADAATAISTANGAVSTANSAVTTANAAAADATAAVATANTADTNASAAVSTANAASSTATSADNKADQAIAAVATALLFDTVANVAAIPASPADGDAVEIIDATGIESFTPLSGLPSGFIGDNGLSVRLIYQSAGSTWIWLQYFPQDPDNRYAGPNTAAGTAAAPSIAFGPTDTNTGIYSPGADELALVTGGTAQLTIDSSGNVTLGTLVADSVTFNTVLGVLDGGSLIFEDQTQPYLVSFQAGSGGTANVTFTLPTADGTAGQLLSTDGSGNLSWTGDVLALSGGTMAGDIDMGSNLITNVGSPISPQDAASKAYVDTANSTQDTAIADKLPLTGGTLTGTLTLAAGPVNALEAATKSYVDNKLVSEIRQGNTVAEVIDSLYDGRFVITTEGSEALTVDYLQRVLIGTSTSSGNYLLEVNGAIKDSTGSIRSVPQNSQTSSYTLVATDTGKHISITTGGVTVPASVFSVGDIVTIYNNSGSNQTITQGASTTLRQAGTANTGNRTLAQYGVATVLCVASNTFVISGAGLS